MQKEIIALYKNGRPIREISRKLSLDRRNIKNILEENKVKIRNSRTALIQMGHIKEKRKFKLNKQNKAYLFGLVSGDLTPVKKSNYTLKLITHTTHIFFADLLYRIFAKYGPTNYIINKRGEFRFQSHLDLESFAFLLKTKKEEIPNWIKKENFLSYLAGFVDSDGSIIIRKTGEYFQYVIRFFGENLKILKEIKTRLQSLGYRPSMHKNHSKGDSSNYKGIKIKYNKDYYCLEIYRKAETLRLMKEIPIKHPEKIAKIKLISSIKKRNILNWKEIKVEVKALKSRIKESVLSKEKLNLMH
ncbi:MAG: LAGLIDADG family homing endonuclease [Candidatus Nanoarchaeia archaeon]|nr:LAGLIDADG family homing endonuclease [Candidatus Nanoarchaeia archaeon]